MPIRFRCSYCNRLLGIATRKAGTETTCPHCGYTITVPFPREEESKTDRLDLGDVDEMLGKSAAAGTGEPAVLAPPARPAVVSAPALPEEAHPVKPAATRAQPSPRSSSAQKGTPRPAHSDDRPLFENDVDELLGEPAASAEPPKPKAPPVSGPDARGLDDTPRSIVLTGGMATLLVIVVAALMAASFAAGYLLAPR